MSALADIAINDGAATPVTHTFTPRSSNPANYRNGSVQNANFGIMFDENITLDVNVNPNGMSKVKITMIIPDGVVNLTTGLISDSWFQTVKMEFLIPAKTSVQNRKDLRTLASNLLLNSQVVAAIDNLEMAY